MTLVITQLLTNIWFFWAKGLNCCQELRAVTASACDSSAFTCPADATTMRCADLLSAIAAPASSFPPALTDWACNAFPDDSLPGDSLLVALIALAVAMPVTIFLSGCFEVANDSDAPESWLRYAGTVRMVCGKLAHRRWHYTGPLGQPKRFVRWFVRCSDAPAAETILNVLHSLRAALTGVPPYWVSDEHQEAAEADGYDDAEIARRNTLQLSIRVLMGEHENLEATLKAQTLATRSEKLSRARRLSQESAISWKMYGHAVNDVGSSHAELSPAEEARLLRRKKRQLTAIGLGGVLLVWIVMVWFICTYGLLIFELLGRDAQRSFTRSWGVSYGVSAATEWRDVLREAILSILVLAVLERVHLTRRVSWLEEHIDYMSTAALLLEHGGLSYFQELRLFFTFRRRLGD